MLESMLKEVDILRKLNHENILKFKDLFLLGEFLFIITEKMDMNLVDYLNKFHDKMTEAHFQYIIKKITKALKYCHQHNTVHLDVKPHNVLINVNDRGKITDIRLADFGLAVSMSEGVGDSPAGTCRIVCGTKGYMAPEMLDKDTRLDSRLDSYSLGVVLYNIICGSMPPKELRMSTNPAYRRKPSHRIMRYGESAWSKCSVEA